MKSTQLLSEAVQDVSQLGQPMLMRRGRYGRRDYERFDHLMATSPCAGYGSIGKVKVNCRLRFAESQWGVFGATGKPAGIMYMDLDFDQPPDCRLTSTTVLVSLEPYMREEGSVRFTDHYGPKKFSGRLTKMSVRDKVSVNPHAEALGFGGGLFSVEKEKEKVVTGRWIFSGQLVPSKERSWEYKTLKWELAENPLESQATHANVFHTGFAFEHDGMQFHMTVKIKGTLTHWSNRLREKMRFGRDDNSTTTLVRFHEQYSFRRPLDDLASGLGWAMQEKNMVEIPVEIPDAMPASFRQEVPQPSRNPQSAQDQQMLTGPQLLLLNQRVSRESLRLAELQPNTLTLDDEPISMEKISDAAGLVSLLRDEEVQRLSPDNRSSRHGSSTQSSATLAAAEMDHDAGPGMENMDNVQKGVDVHVGLLPWLSKMPFVLVLIRLICSVLGYDGVRQPRGGDGKEFVTKGLERDEVLVPSNLSKEKIYHIP